MKICKHEPGYPDHEFEVVDAIPMGYLIWHIGEHAPKGYLPLCRLKAIQPFPDGRSIEPDTLKAVRTDGEQEILRASACGYDTAKKMRKCIDEGKDPYEVELCEKALPFMEAITDYRAEA